MRLGNGTIQSPLKYGNMNHGYCKNCFWYKWNHCFTQDVGTKDDSYCPDYINRNRTKETLDDYLKGWIEHGLISNDELELIKENGNLG